MQFVWMGFLKSERADPSRRVQQHITDFLQQPLISDQRGGCLARLPGVNARAILVIFEAEDRAAAEALASGEPGPVMPVFIANIICSNIRTRWGERVRLNALLEAILQLESERRGYDCEVVSAVSLHHSSNAPAFGFAATPQSTAVLSRPPSTGS